MTGCSSYRLDELGWLQFERLCELVLRAELGLRVEMWRGHADECRWTTIAEASELDRGEARSGPVGAALFWCRPPRTEVETLVDLAERWATLRDDPSWRGVTRWVVCVNGDAARARAMCLLQLPAGVDVTVLGTQELNTSISAHPEIRAALPSLLGLTNLDPLIDRDSRTRSTFDVGEAQHLARVFWSTRAYDRARAVLARHGFVVLTGPPEMGKTAIAEMIALTQLTDGWEAHACTDPDQVRGLFDRDRRQVFIADDAFGSTEYRPDSAERWALALGELLQMLGPQHWLIWTSRPAPLKAGLARVQRERGSERFPSPGEVLVDASDLALDEKTLILFRHAKAQGVGGLARTFLQSTGVFLVEHPHFTPERIRRFVTEHVGAWRQEPDDMLDIADQVLSSPSEAMRTSFNALGQEHRDLLVALLDAPAGLIDERELAATVRRHHPGGLSRPPRELIDRLTDHFLKITPLGIGWVHPSWRDLVIDELRGNQASRSRFLAACGIEGATLAVSHQGGALGERSLPLMRTDADWDQLLDRVLRLLAELEPRDTARLLLALTQSVEELTDRYLRGEAESLATTVLNSLRERWDRERMPLPPFLLEAWYRLADSLPQVTEAPALAPTWVELHPGSRLLEQIDQEELLRVDEWLAVAQILRNHHAVALASLGFYERDQELLQRLIVSLTQASAANPEIRPLAQSVLDRIRSLCPHLDREAASALTLTELAQALDAKTWWSPHDLAAPPSSEPVVPGQFARVDVERVLQDL
jgi:hypothetical protein